jgi:hypothetical protein
MNALRISHANLASPTHHNVGYASRAANAQRALRSGLSTSSPIRRHSIARGERIGLLKHSQPCNADRSNSHRRKPSQAGATHKPHVVEKSKP